MYKQITAPDGDRHFNTWWEPKLPPSPAETRLSALRREHGNAKGTRIFRDELPAKKSVWF